MKLTVILAMALAAVAVADTASARPRQKGSIAKGSVVAPKKTFSPKVIQPAETKSTTKGIIMRDGGVCDPIRHMGC